MLKTKSLKHEFGRSYARSLCRVTALPRVSRFKQFSNRKSEIELDSGPTIALKVMGSHGSDGSTVCRSKHLKVEGYFSKYLHFIYRSSHRSFSLGCIVPSHSLSIRGSQCPCVKVMFGCSYRLRLRQDHSRSIYLLKSSLTMYLSLIYLLI